MNFERPLPSLKELEVQLRSTGAEKHANYVKMIIQKYSIINTIQPQNFEQFHEDFFTTLSDEDLKVPFPYKKKNVAFHEIIVKIMRYDAVREAEILPYIKKLGIKACVYCNTQLAITVDAEDQKYKGKYELDHFRPKSQYPYLCTSFFNLQPCCSNCNRSKNDRKGLFDLYTKKKLVLNPFVFQVSSESIVQYLMSLNCDELEIIFDSSDKALKKNHEELFHITELYKTQTDVVEEIIWKSKVYNLSYRKSLLDSFPSELSSNIDFNRFILGNYCKDSEVHKRPMAKLVQDIAKQLGII